jgi:hypothetical protein
LGEAGIDIGKVRMHAALVETRIVVAVNRFVGLSGS